MKLEEVLFEVTSNNLIQIRIEGKIKLWNLSHYRLRTLEVLNL